MSVEVIVAAIITGTAAVTAAVIGARRKHQAEGPSVSKTEIAPKIENEVERKKTVLNPKLSYDDIDRALNNVPPFQRQALEKSFLGRRVTWFGQIRSISHIGDKIHVRFRLSNSRDIVTCSASPERCAGLEVAPEGTELYFTGTLSEVGSFTVLTDCVFYSSPPTND